MATEQAKGTETVTIACKLPHGLRLRLFRKVKISEPVLGGGFRDTEISQETGDEFVVHGWSHAQNKAPHTQIEQGFAALTLSCPKSFWDEWLRQNKDSSVVKNGLIFAHEKTASVVAEAKEKVEVRSGLERLDPSKMPRNIQKSDLMKSSSEALVA